MKMDDSSFLMLNHARRPEVLKRFSNVLLWGAGYHASKVVSGFEPSIVSFMT